ncbi:universal stress protein [Natranaeroarchaeum aerophilus]|uniref:Universal stress protein n=1 Tax=Natranaeroarchaeum aerophilus TaxID=2917711 RepID=A0AAE3K505_9EURY|nr:universal stress protein [Natranaeroarchaeum aerophilus]MCL9813927.1 universal stress protein [Natranaeroarchaeum aerophilus]
MFNQMLVPTDGSEAAAAAVGHATDLADAFGIDVHALYVVETGEDPSGLADEEYATLHEASEQRGREATIRIAEDVEEAGLEAARAVREGVPYTTILEYVDEHDIDIVVMGTHGRTGADRVRMGSTTERVLMRADVPVLSVPRSADPAVDGSYERIVVPTDGSDAAERAAGTALDVAERYGADVRVVYVVDPTAYDLGDAPRSIIGLLKTGGNTAVEEVATMARERGLDVATTVRRGVPAEELLSYASMVDADLLAMGTRGRSVGSGRLLGSTTARVVRRSSIPVLTVN